MATSEKGHYVRFDESTIGALDACSSGKLRRALSNLDHLADQYAQTRIKWVSIAGNNGFVPQADDPTIMGPGNFFRVWTSSPFDLHVYDSGESYRCRLRARIAPGSTDPVSEFATFRFVLAPEGTSESELDVGGVNVATASTFNGESAAWVSAGMIYLDVGMTARARKSVAAINTIGGATVNARWLRAQLVVFGASSDGDSAFPTLSGIDLCEYVHP